MIMIISVMVTVGILLLLLYISHRQSTTRHSH